MWLYYICINDFHEVGTRIEIVQFVDGNTKKKNNN